MFDHIKHKRNNRAKKHGHVRALVAFMALELTFSGIVSAATFTTSFSTPSNYSSDSEVEVSGGLAKIKTNPLWNGLSAYWKMDENSGQISDSSGNGNNSTAIVGGIGYGYAGKLNQSINFKEGGVNGKINITEQNSLAFTNGFSYGAWFKADSFSTWAGIMSRMRTWGHGYNLQVGTSQRIACGFGAYTRSDFMPVAGQWYHAVCVYDGSKMSLYVNGVKQTDEDTRAMDVGLDDMQLGVFYTRTGNTISLPFDGVIDEAFVYNRVLSESEIQELYNSGNGKEITQYEVGTFEIYKSAGDTDSDLISFSGFSATPGSGNQGDFRYQLSTDGSTWQYWDGSAWSNVSSTTDYNTEAEINAHIATFPTTAKKIFVKSFLISDGSQRTELDELQVTYSQKPLTPANAPDLRSSSDTGASDTDNVTSDTTPTFDINCSVAGNTITLYEGVAGAYNQIGTHVCIGTGTESVTANTLSAGNYDITYTDSNSHEESDHSPALSVVVDTSAPAIAITAPTHLSNASITDTTIRVTDNHGINAGDVVVGAATTADYTSFNCTQTSAIQVDCTISIDGPTDGNAYTLAIDTEDIAGNTSTESESGYVIDVTPPAPPVITGITTDTGSSDTDGITSDTTLVFSGTAEAGSTVELFLAGSSMGTTSADAAGDWTFDYTGTTLADGDYTFTATAMDAAGNTSGSSTDFNVTIDTVAPNVSVDSPTSDETVGGTAEPGVTIGVTTPSGASCSTTSDAQGAWSCVLSGKPLDGEAIDVTAEDAAGNTSSVTGEADTDGVPSGEEDGGPNGGDMNGDGIPDSRQPDVTTYINSIVGGYVSTTVSGGYCEQINRAFSVRESDLATQDAVYDYFIGFHGVEVECNMPGATATITHYWDKEYDTSNWLYRKYLRNEQKYSEFTSHVTFGVATVAGRRVTTVTFSITDGGPFDGDGVANARILDPLGPAVNTPPVADDDSAATPQDTPVTIDVLDGDTDADGDTLVVSEINGTAVTPGDGVEVQIPHGTATLLDNGQIRVAPESGYAGTISFPYTVSDGKGGTDEGQVEVKICDASAPTIETIGNLETVDDVDTYYYSNGKDLHVTGTAKPGQEVRVKFGDLDCVTHADENGNWSCTLEGEVDPGYHDLIVETYCADGSMLAKITYTLGIRVGLAETGEPALLSVFAGFAGLLLLMFVRRRMRSLV